MMTFRRRVDACGCALLRTACYATYGLSDLTDRAFLAVDRLADWTDRAENSDRISASRTIAARLAGPAARLSGAALTTHDHAEHLHQLTVAAYHWFMIGRGLAEPTPTGAILVYG